MKKNIVLIILSLFLCFSLILNLIQYNNYNDYQGTIKGESSKLTQGVSYNEPLSTLFNNTIEEPSKQNLTALYYELNNVDTLINYLVSINKRNIEQSIYRQFNKRSSSKASPTFLLNLTEQDKVSEKDIITIKQFQKLWMGFINVHLEKRSIGDELILTSEELSELIKDYLALSKKIDELES